MILRSSNCLSLVVSIVCLFLASAADSRAVQGAQNDKGLQSTIIQKNAGKKLNRGWFLAHSSNERFRISVPTQFNEWAIPVEKGNVVNMIGSKSSDGFNFVVIEFPRELYPARADLRTIVNAYFAEQPPQSKRFRKFRGFASAQVKTVGLQRSKETRYVMTSGFLYQLSVDYPNTQQRLANKQAKRFFRSFGTN